MDDNRYPYKLAPGEEIEVHPQRTAVKIALGYAAVSWIWILVSDRIVPLFSRDPATMIMMNSLKGSFFVLVTASILFLLVYTQLRQIQAAQERYILNVQDLETAHEELTATDEELRQQFDEMLTQTNMLAEKDKEMWSLFENMHDAFALHQIVLDDSGTPVDYTYLAVNPAYEQLLGMTSQEIVGRRVLELFPEVEASWILTCGDVALHGGGRKLKRFSKQLGRDISISLYSPQPGRFALLMRDISDEKRHTQIVERLAYYDGLTGLPNRAYLVNTLRFELEENQGALRCGVVFYLDMDDLKMINDSYGHSYGDAILITAAMHMVSLVTSGSMVARVGGDEFVVLAPNITDTQQVEILARELVDTLSREYEVKDLLFHSSASIGVAIYPLHGNTAEEILKNADTALYEAKRSGKRCWRIFQKSMQEKAYENMLLINGLRNAISNDELSVYYQPQITLGDFGIRSFEALLRWQSPKHGNVSPAQFIALAEKSHLINEIGEWVLNEACRFCRNMINAGFDQIKIAVNVSPRQLVAADFIDIVKKALERARLEPGRLEIEITENSFIETMDDSVKKLLLLQKMGINVALDDFGTGYSSLTYLRNLPVETVKIDKSFISMILNDSTHKALISSIVEMAHVLGLSVVAEGVETIEQLRCLLDCRCDTFQGYIASRPVPEAEALESLRRNQIPGLLADLLEKAQNAG